MPEITPATVSLIITIIGLIISGVWFVARLSESLRVAMERGDEELRKEMLGMLDAAGRARDGQIAGVVADLRELSRGGATRDEVRVLETRISAVLQRIEGKMDGMAERVAATQHLNDSVRALSGRIESLDNRIPRAAAGRSS